MFTIVASFVSGALLAADAPRMQSAPGLEATLVGAEPHVINPTSIEVDSRGRIWVAEGLNYRFFANGQFKRLPGADRIKILEDTDGDGKIDKHTVFASDIYPVPMGLAIQELWKDGKYAGCRVYTGNSPDILVLEDLNGDDKAESRRPLLSGFGGYDSDHGVHGMFFGPDGKLYFTQGDGKYGGGGKPIPRGMCMSVTGPDGRKVEHNREASVLRCNPDGTGLELLATGMRNNYETTVDAFGGIFASDNDDDGNRGCRTCWVIPGAHYGYHTPGSSRHWGEEVPGNMPKLVGTGNGSPGGIFVYEGDLLPPEYRGAVFQVDAGTRQINFHPLTRVAGGLRTEYKVLLKGDDPKYRPIDAAVAPDGSIYVADWHDDGVGGHRFTDQTTGRVFRLAPKGNKPSRPKPDFGSEAGVVSALASPNPATWFTARSILNSAEGARYRNGLRETARGGSPVVQARAAWILGAESLRDAAEPRLQEARYRIDALHDGNKEALAAASGDLKGVDPGVRRVMLESLAQRGERSDAIDAAIVKLAAAWNGEERFYLETIGIALRSRPSATVAALFDGLSERAASEAGAPGTAFPPYYPVGSNDAFPLPGDKLPTASAASKLIGIAWALERAEALPALQRLISARPSAETSRSVDAAMARIRDPKAADALAELFLRQDDPQRRAMTLELFGSRLAGPWRNLRDAAATKRVFEAGLASDELRTATIRAAGAAGLAAYAERFRKWLADDKQDLTVRNAAIEALGRMRDGASKPALERILADARGSKSSAPLAGAALEALAEFQGREAIEKVLTDSGQPAALRRRAVQLLARTQPGAQRLLDLHAARRLADDVLAEAAYQLNHHANGGIRQKAAAALPIPTTAGRKVDARAVLAASGDAEEGRALFLRDKTNACGKCHRVQGIGQWVGPDLSAIGEKYGKPELLYHVLQPSGAIAHGYATSMVRMADGRNLTGLVTEESPERVVLKTAQNERLALRTSEVEQRGESATSVMPDKLADEYSDRQLADMLAFLATLRRPVAECAEYMVAGPAAGLDGAAPVGASARKVAAGRDGFLDLSAMLPAKEGVAVLTAFPAQSAAAQTGRLVVNSFTPVEAWLNGRKVEMRTSGGGEESSFQGDLPLRAGDNLVTIKVASGKVKTGITATVVADRMVRITGDAAKAKAAQP